MNITSPTFHFLFLATMTGGNAGDIAIDDITIKECPSSPPPPPTCPPEEWRCADGRQCIPLKQRCNGPTNCEDKSDEGGCLTDCSPLYCVNGGSCHIRYGEMYCYCAWPYTGRRCEVTIFGTRPPSTGTPATTEAATTEAATTREPTREPTLVPIVCSPQACEPHSLSCVCDPVSDPEYCLACEQTVENCETCVCQTIGEARRVCYRTQAYANALRESQEPGNTPEPGDGNSAGQGQDGSGGGDNSKWSTLN